MSLLWFYLPAYLHYHKNVGLMKEAKTKTFSIINLFILGLFCRIKAFAFILTPTCSYKTYN